MRSSTAFHPSSAVLLDHVAGTLSFAHSCIVSTHVLYCPTCQDMVSFLEKTGDLLLAGVQPVQPPSGLLERCLSSVAQDQAPHASTQAAGSGARTRCALGDTVLPPSLDGLKPSRLRWLAPGIRHSTLWRDDRSTLHLIRVKAGVMLPAHRHHGLELTCVLSGAYQDDGKLYVVGDVSEEDDGGDDHSRREQDHLVVAEPPEDCVCIMATTGRLRFSGWMARLLQPVMPF